MATLKIKNVTGAELEIEPGGAPVKLAAGAEADLSDKELMSKGFVKVVEAGSVSFVNVVNPSQDQIELARKVLPSLVATMRDRIGNYKGRFEQSQRELLKLRESFNKAWKIAEAHLAVAQTSTSGWPAVKQAVKSFLLDTKPEDPSVTEKKADIAAITEAIDNLKNEVLEPQEPSGRSREEWFADRVAKEQALKEAQAELANMSAQKADPLATEVASVDGTVVALATLTADKAIGKEIAEFGK